MSNIAIIKTEVKRYIDIAREQYKVNIPYPDVSLSNRMTKAAGLAKKTGNTYSLCFSLPIIKLNGVEKFLQGTIPHEVAHIVQWCVYGDANHGRTFYHVMHKLGIKTATRCHSYTVPPKRNICKFKVTCLNCGKQFEVSTRVYNKLNLGMIFTHRSCGGKIKPIN